MGQGKETGHTCDLHNLVQLVHGGCPWEHGLPTQQLPQDAAYITNQPQRMMEGDSMHKCLCPFSRDPVQLTDLLLLRMCVQAISNNSGPYTHNCSQNAAACSAVLLKCLISCLLRTCSA